jgi:high affinity Mn2+ porin
MPRVSNGMAQDTHYLKAWGLVAEIERRFSLNEHPGAIRLLGYLNSAHMGSYEEAVESPVRPADIVATRDYRYKAGVGLNMEQEVITNVGVFSQLGWSDGNNEAWVFSDVDRAATIGVSVKGAFWGRPNDTVGAGGVFNAASRQHADFFAAGGTGILAGDGKLTYGLEKIMEVYYDLQIWKTLHGALDYQFVSNPAFNHDRGPVHVLAARIHWEL